MVNNLVQDLEKRTMSKIFKRLMPLLIICMFVSFMDRINVGFASLTMNKDLGLSAAAYGFGAGLFFIGYFLFEIPSNLILEKIGPKIWITRIMVTWGAISACMAFVQGPNSFYAMRFLLGLAEAGFFPGVVYLLTFWFRRKERAQAVGIFLCGSYFGGAIGSPISGLVMTYLNGVLGFAGWQWLFIMEGIPAIILAGFVWKMLPNNPQSASWLEPEEKEWIVGAIDAENKATTGEVKHISLWKTLSNPKTLLLSVVYLCFCIGNLGLSMWLPQLIKTAGKDLSTLSITLYSMLPYWVFIFSMIAITRHSDKTQERRWHITIFSLIAAAGLFVTAGTASLAVTVTSLILVGIGFAGTQPIFWGAATQTLDPKESAAAIALINSVGNLGGFLGPNIVGVAKSITGAYQAGVYIFSGCFVLIAVLINVVYAVNKDKFQKLGSETTTI